jgi:hypothetical protein
VFELGLFTFVAHVIKGYTAAEKTKQLCIWLLLNVGLKFFRSNALAGDFDFVLYEQMFACIQVFSDVTTAEDQQCNENKANTGYSLSFQK